jgi:hypothetical protein
VAAVSQISQEDAASQIDELKRLAGRPHLQGAQGVLGILGTRPAALVVAAAQQADLARAKEFPDNPLNPSSFQRNQCLE